MKHLIPAVIVAVALAAVAFGQSRDTRMGVNGGSSSSSSSGSPAGIQGQIIQIDAGFFNNGTVGQPSIAWNSDNDGTGTGIYRSAANEIAFAINGALAFKMSGVAQCITGGSNGSMCLNDSIGALIGWSTSTLAFDGTNVIVATGGQFRTTTGLRLNTAGAVAPTCDSTTRGMLWYTASAGGVADKMEVCAKSTLDAYAWRSMATIP